MPQIEMEASPATDSSVVAGAMSNVEAPSPLDSATLCEMLGSTKANVYVVDDCEIDRQSIWRLLRGQGVKVVECAMAEDFIDKYEPKIPGCLILDVNLPGMSGLDLQKVLNEAKIALPIVVVSGDADVPQSSQAFRAGAVDVLLKPVDATQFKQRVGQALLRDRNVIEERAANAAVAELRNGLTKRENEVLTLLMSGTTIKQLARMLGVGMQTAAKHRSRVLDKMGVETDVELINLIRQVS